MTGSDETPPVAEDDFPEFAAPPRQAPDLAAQAAKKRAEETVSSAQEEADAVIARLRRQREERGE